MLGGKECAAEKGILRMVERVPVTEQVTIKSTETDVLQRLPQEDRAILEAVRTGLPLVADLHRSDMLIYLLDGGKDAYVYAHARPHSMASLYPEEQTGRRVALDQVPVVRRVWYRSKPSGGQRQVLRQGAPVVEHGVPIFGKEGQLIAVLVVETNMMEAHRLKLRARSFRYMLRWLLNMLVSGRLARVQHISPFGEVDGLLLVDSDRIIRYISGRGRGVYRRLGYLGDLVGHPLRHLDTDDNRLVIQAFTVGTPLEVEVEEHGRYLIKSVIPLHADIPVWQRIWLSLTEGWHWPPYGRIWQGALIIVRDVTEERQREEELHTKSMLLREVHHRVKNNLQTIASLLSMQARRARDNEAQQQLLMAASRVRAVAEIHEFLQYQEGQSMVSLRDLAQQVWNQVARAIVPTGKRVKLRIEGSNVRLVGQQATAMALVINELVLNAVQHGVQDETTELLLRIVDFGPIGRVEVINPGDRLPLDFDIQRTSGLGLKIVQTLVRNELGGELKLHNDERGVVAEVTFQKRIGNRVRT